MQQGSINSKLMGTWGKNVTKQSIVCQD